MRGYKPVALLAPRLFVSDHVGNFTLAPGLDLIGRVQGNEDVTAALDPNGVPESVGELSSHRLLVGQKAAVQLVALGFDDSGNRLIPFQLVWRSHRLLGCSANVVFGTTHFAEARYGERERECVCVCLCARYLGDWVFECMREGVCECGCFGLGGRWPCTCSAMNIYMDKEKCRA